MNDTIELDLREIGYMLLRRFWIILLCATLVGASVLIYTVGFVAPTYKSSIKMYVKTDNQSITSSDRNVALSLVDSYVEMINSDKIMDRVAARATKDLGTSYNAGKIRDMMDIVPVEDTEMFEVSIVSTSPQLSADIANIIAEEAPAELVNIMTGSTIKVLDHALPANSRYAPNYVTSTILGLAVGAVLAVIVLVMQVLLDIHVKREEDLTKIFAVPVLGIIPEITEETEKAHRKGRR